MTFIKKNPVLIIAVLVIVATFVFVGIRNNQNSFNENQFSSYRAMDNIEELCSEEYKGRLAGSSGNLLALEYIEEFFSENGIEPAGDNGTYYQEFSTLIPDFKKGSIFTISDEKGNILHDYEMFMDYNALTDMNGGSIDYDGELLLVGQNILRINPEYIKDRVVVVATSYLQADKVQYVMENGGLGILCAADVKMYVRSRYFEQVKGLNAAGKTGNSIMVGYISTELYKTLEEYMIELEGDDSIMPDGIVPSAQIKVDIEFPIIDTANILGKIDGKNQNGRYLLITANLDSVGEGEGIRYFPGAISNTSGLAVMMEIAKATKEQESTPYETIVFIGFNGQQRQKAGSEYYLENPIYPLDKTTVIHLEDLGVSTIEGLRISSDSIVSKILKSRIANFALDAGLDIEKRGPYYNPAGRFVDYKAPGIMLSDAIFQQNTYSDVEYTVDQASIKNAGLVVMNYLKRDIFKDFTVNYMSPLFIVILSLLAAVLLFNILSDRLFKMNPNMNIFGKKMETLYYSGSVMTIRRVVKLVIPIAIALFMLVFIANLDRDLNITKVNGELVSNFSFYLTLKKTLMYFQNIFRPSSTTSGGGDIASTIFGASIKSLLLMLSALVTSVVVGIARGLYEGYRSKRKNLRSLGTLIVFSIPDVLIVLAGMLLYIYIAQNMRFLGNVSMLRKFILPFITLTILPSIYISRITYITVQDELKLEYIMSAKAKGLSRRRIFTSELLPAVSFKIVDSLPAIITMLFSNMIIVEYLFNYLGLMNYLIYFYNRLDINGFIATAVTMGAIYMLLTWGIQYLAGFINPLKRRIRK